MCDVRINGRVVSVRMTGKEHVSFELLVRMLRLVAFEDEQTAQEAIRRYNQTRLLGKVITVREVCEATVIGRCNNSWRMCIYVHICTCVMEVLEMVKLTMYVGF